MQIKGCGASNWLWYVLLFFFFFHLLLSIEKIDLWAGERNICPSQKRKEEISRAIGGEWYLSKETLGEHWV